MNVNLITFGPEQPRFTPIQLLMIVLWIGSSAFWNVFSCLGVHKLCMAGVWLRPIGSLSQRSSVRHSASCWPTSGWAGLTGWPRLEKRSFCEECRDVSVWIQIRDVSLVRYDERDAKKKKKYFVEKLNCGHWLKIWMPCIFWQKKVIILFAISYDRPFTLSMTDLRWPTWLWV